MMRRPGRTTDALCQLMTLDETSLRIRNDGDVLDLVVEEL